MPISRLIAASVLYLGITAIVYAVPFQYFNLTPNVIHIEGYPDIPLGPGPVVFTIPTRQAHTLNSTKLHSWTAWAGQNDSLYPTKVSSVLWLFNAATTKAKDKHWHVNMHAPAHTPIEPRNPRMPYRTDPPTATEDLIQPRHIVHHLAASTPADETSKETPPATPIPTAPSEYAQEARLFKQRSTFKRHSILTFGGREMIESWRPTVSEDLPPRSVVRGVSLDYFGIRIRRSLQSWRETQRQRSRERVGVHL